MEQYTDAMQMMDLMVQPAFCVKNGIIVKVNAGAAGYMLEEGTPVSALMQTGAEEYAAFSGGCLYLNLSVCGQLLGFSVIRQADLDIFRLDQESDAPELRAMALAARELREPLANVMHLTRELLPASSQQAAQLNRGLYRMLRIIGNMSDADRYCAAGTGHMEYRDVCAVVDEIFDKAAALAQHADVCLTYEGHPESVCCLTDSEKLEKAILNIISNALKFSPKGGTIAAKLTRKGDKLYLSVQDSGCGLSNSVRGNLFSRHTRQPGIEDGQFGIGLGMVLIRAAAALHGGTVLVDQPARCGTRITMTLSIRQNTGSIVRCPVMGIDYSGELDPALIALSDVLPADLYDPENID